MIQDIFDTGKDIFELSPALCSKKENERMKLANLLELIGHLVKEAAEKLRYGQLPASRSQQFDMLSEELYFRLAFSVGEMKARLLSGKLKSGCMAWQRQDELAPSLNHHYLAQLDAAAGYFLATSDNLRTAMDTPV